VITKTDGLGRLVATDEALTGQALRALATAEELLVGVALHPDIASGADCERASALADVALTWVRVAEAYTDMKRDS
jgi:hypothetical protein